MSSNSSGLSSVDLSQQPGGGGIGFFGLLAILFIALKLTGHVQWSWLWVLSPIWIPVSVAIGLLVVFGILAVWSKS